MFWQKRIYADAAAATPLSARAYKELVRVLGAYGNPGGLHREALAARAELDRARRAVAKAIGAHHDEIVFTASGTEANNVAILGTLGPRLRAGESLGAVTSAIEHPSVLAPMRSLEREGLALAVAQVGQDGLVSPAAVAAAADARTALVSIQLVNSEMGAVQPVREIGKALRRIRVEGDAPDMSKATPSISRPLFHVDASQAPLWLEIRVEKLGVDLMTLDAQKILGPKGIGCLYVQRGTLIDPIIWGGGQEGGKRAGTENAPLAAAFAAALEDAQTNPEARAKKVAAVRDFLWSEIIKRIPDAVLHGPSPCPKVQPQDTASRVIGDFAPSRVANNLSISIPGLDGQMAVIALDAAGVAVSTRSACLSDDDEPSYVMQALGLDRQTAKSAIRITLLPDASVGDARRIARALAEIARRYKTDGAAWTKPRF